MGIPSFQIKIDVLVLTRTLFRGLMYTLMTRNGRGANRDYGFRSLAYANHHPQIVHTRQTPEGASLGHTVRRAAKAVRYITLMATIFAVFLPVAVKTPPASGAGKGINLFTVNLIAVILPPCASALIAAKTSGLAFRLLDEVFSAVAALVLACLGPAANGFDRVHGQAEHGSDLTVGQPFTAKK